ncbi:MAG TPA: DNA-3-methyladenine glycosylase, partial [Chitinophagaceae bacterium]|nr:DNA-3-methyladenine glycosylase [Chitinophagaceae bacterium]
MQKLSLSFYKRADVQLIARELLGKLLVSRFNNIYTVGRIIETEAYAGETDRASHAYAGRRTARTEVMYGSPGKAYVYLCYGIHHLFNVVTNMEGIPHAVLVRAIEPVEGIPAMLNRTGKSHAGQGPGRGPGNCSKALGITTLHSGVDLTGDTLFIARDKISDQPLDIGTSPRIGVDYAGEDALLPWRFFVRGYPGLSGPKSF